ncbi:acetyl esterase [Solirubrobacter pauli]|uniref:Acetyl esterase n=1 Tax=Solirubrobacter pauli TaxID=166793 RepID=A0A660KXV0_9ACTN|nr:alpha/beta hydrolase [Solirubrobacter pauli]RKQ86551.1 acetyl esterase [Solirubrobacter pauli]
MNPEVQRILDALPDDGPPAHEVPIEQARQAHLTETEVLAGEGVPVDRVFDDEIAGVPVRVYEPAEATGTIAYLHGGGWVMGSRDSVDAVCRALAGDARARVVSVGYRLAPEHPFPAALDDTLNVVRALEGPVAVAGDSAGGNLAAVAALKLPNVVFQLLIYPVTDAGLNTPSYSEFDGDFGLTAASMRRFFKLYLDGADGLQPDVSPLRADLGAAPPALVITASHDVLRDDGEAYAAALPDAELRRIDGTVHGFWRWQTTEIARTTVREAAAAVRQALG